MDAILIVRLSAIGDVVHALPAVAALRAAHPAARITWVAERSAAAILDNVPVVDRVIEVDTRRWRRHLLRKDTRAAVAAGLGRLRSESFDVAVDMQGLLKSGFVAWLSGARRRVGFARAALREPASQVFLTEQVDVDDRAHVIAKNCRLAEHLGAVAGEQWRFPIEVPPAIECAVEARLPRSPFVILNPGGGWPTKLWRAADFGRLADRLHDSLGLVSLVTHGPGEEALAAEVTAATHAGSAMVFPCTLLEFVALARRAAIFVGGDTGPLHLAASQRTPIVGLYGPTDSRRNGPFDVRDTVVERTDLACRVDCYRRRCDHWECLDITVETVLRAAAARLEAQ
jgi:lipopolysaccharide heptosyltransferase I